MSLKGALEPKQETLEEFISEVTKNFKDEMSIKFTSGGIKLGAKWQQERMYSEEDLISFAHFYFQEEFNSTMQTSKSTDEILQEWFEQFKKK